MLLHVSIDLTKSLLGQLYTNCIYTYTNPNPKLYLTYFGFYLNASVSNVSLFAECYRNIGISHSIGKL